MEYDSNSLEGQETHQLTHDEWKTLMALADSGDMASTVAHEFNNFLNNITLHVTLLQSSLPEAQRLDLAEMRKQTVAATRVLREFQLSYRRRPAVTRIYDLNRIINECLSRHTEPPWAGVKIQKELHPTLPCVQARPYDMDRLCTFLIRNALGVAASTGGAITVRTQRAGAMVRLSVENYGTNADPALLALFFEPTNQQRDGVSSLELATCLSIVRRLNGMIWAENRSTGRVAIVADIPTLGLDQTKSEDPTSSLAEPKE